MAASLVRVGDHALSSCSLPLHFTASINADYSRKQSSISMGLLKSSHRPFLSSGCGFTSRGVYFTSVTRRASCVASAVPVSDLSNFAEQETVKFRKGLIEMLEPVQIPQDSRGKIAEICSNIFRSFVVNYNGELPAEPFGKMRKALDSEGLPGSEVARAALGWARCNLHYDWKKYTGADS